MENDIQEYVQNSVTSDDVILTPPSNKPTLFLLHDVVVRGCCKPLQNSSGMNQKYNKLNLCCKILAENSNQEACKCFKEFLLSEMEK